MRNFEGGKPAERSCEFVVVVVVVVCNRLRPPPHLASEHRLFSAFHASIRTEDSKEMLQEALARQPRGK